MNTYQKLEEQNSRPENGGRRYDRRGHFATLPIQIARQVTDIMSCAVSMSACFSDAHVTRNWSLKGDLSSHHYSVLGPYRTVCHTVLSTVLSRIRYCMQRYAYGEYSIYEYKFIFVSEDPRKEQTETFSIQIYSMHRVYQVLTMIRRTQPSSCRPRSLASMEEGAQHRSSVTFHASTTMKQRRQLASDRWTNAVRDVLQSSSDKAQQEEEERDLLGEHIVRILNKHPEFHRSQNETVEEEQEFTPLFTYRNLNRLCQSIRSFRPTRNTADNFAKKIREFFLYISKDRQSALKSLWIFAWVSLLASSILTMSFHVAILWFANAAMLMGTLASALLVDPNEIKSMCPKQLVAMVEGLATLLQWIDGSLLRGNDFVQREWNAKRYVRSGEATSRHVALLKCPPPKQKKDKPDGWSQRTQNHASAIDFCYTMLKREQDKANNKKRRSFKRATSASIIRDPSDALLQTSQSDPPVQSQSVSFGDEGCVYEACVWEDNDHRRIASVFEGGNVQTQRVHSREEERSLELPRHLRITSDDSSRRSYSDTDVFSAIESDEDSFSTYGQSDSSLSDWKSQRVGRQTTSDIDSSLGLGVIDDMGWAEVGARIGMRILSSEHVQRAVASQDTAERLLDISKKVEKNFGTPSSGLRESRRSSQASISNLGQTDVTTSEADTSLTESRSLIKPVHTMWTSASAVRPSSPELMSSMSDIEDLPEPRSPIVPTIRRFASDIEDDSLPPRSQLRARRKSSLRHQASSGSATKSVSFHAKQGLLLEPEKNNPISKDSPNGSRGTRVIDSPCRTEEQDISMEVILMSENGTEGEQICPTKDKTTSLSSGSPASKEYPKRPLLKPGVKVVVPMLPMQPGMNRSAAKGSGRFFQMATVVSSRRIHVQTAEYTSQTEKRKSQTKRRNTNCISVTVNLDKSFLRDGAFAQMTLRIMDAWSDRYMPHHSKFPVGACVATTFGLGVLVGWRVEDDCHIVRALWQRTGAGTADAYLNRDSLHSTVEATIGFPVETALGAGVVISYVAAGREFRHGRYFVQMTEASRHKGQVLEFNRCDILACHGPEFVPVIELIREAAEYQIQVDTYNFAMRHQLDGSQASDEKNWRAFSKGFQIIWSALLKAVEDDEGFDHGVNEFFSTVINFLEQLEKPDLPPESNDDKSQAIKSVEKSVEETEDRNAAESVSSEKQNPHAWFVNDLFGGIFGQKTSGEEDKEEETDTAVAKSQWSEIQYDKAYAAIRALMRTLTIARADCKHMPNLKLGLAIAYEFLLFVRAVIKIQQKNVSAASLAVWERAIEEIITTFGPVKARLQKIGQGIAERIEKHGNKAKIRIIRLVDILVSDEKLLLGLERGEWDICLAQLEQAFVQAGIIDEESRENYHRTIKFMMSHFSPATNGSAASRNKEKLAHFAKALKWLASPRRSLLKMIRNDSTLELLQRIFDRVFRNDPAASVMIAIHASNMTSIRQLRMLKDFTISGKLWIPMLDAADQEFSWVVSKMPDKSHSIMVPLSKLFSLGVAQFHKIEEGDLTADWMDFLMEEEAIRLIHEIDMELILQVESFSKDVQEVMVVLPYYSSIDDDILNLMDEVDMDELLREASEAMVDSDRLANFIRDKSTIAIQRFLDYLPKMSIPVEQRDLGDNWVISCHSEGGGDLLLSDVCIKRENLICQVMGGETICFPMFADDDKECDDTMEIVLTDDCMSSPSSPPTESSILDQIGGLILNAQSHGCWQPGVGGVGQQATDQYVASVLKGLPVSSVLNTGIELWRSLEIDDDELMEIAIKDVSFQIQLQQQREEGKGTNEPVDSQMDTAILMNGVVPPETNPRHRFNPRVDPTLLYLKMKKLTVNLDKFHFRIEKKNKIFFDPVFEGWGTLSIENVSITILVECRKERILKLGTELTVPVLQCRELEVVLEKVKFKVKDTGADWILNKAVEQFSNDLTAMVEKNLQEQIRVQVHAALENLNSYFQINPDLMLSILGITIDDLEENRVWV